jgi:poly(A) polymerase
VEHGIFKPFLPELSNDATEQLTNLVRRENSFSRTPSLPARLLTLLPKDANTVDRVAARLKLSNKLREGLAARVSAPQPNKDNIRSLAYRNGKNCAFDAAMLYASDADIAGCVARLEHWDIPSFPLKGGDLIAMGLDAGPVVAKTLKAIEASWISQGFPDNSALAEIAAQSVAEARSALRKA